MEAPEREGAAGVTVWYDGGCPICTREVGLMRRLDRRGAVVFRDVSQAGDAADLPKPPQTLLARFHAAQDGRLYEGAAAFALVWRNIPPLRWAGRLAMAPPVLWLLERAYDGFMRIRPALQAVARRSLGGGARR